MRSHAKGASLLVFLTMMMSAVLAPNASAATTAYGYLATFGAGEVGGTVYGGPLPTRNGVAVDLSTGNIAAPSFGEVRIFAPDPVAGGTSLTTVAPVEMFTTAVVIDQATGDLYAQASEGLEFANWLGRIERFTSDGAPTPTYTYDSGYTAPLSPGGDNNLKIGTAFDPTTGELVAVSHGANEVERLDPTTGALVSSFEIRETTRAIAVGLDGTVYVGDAKGKGILRYTTSGTELPILPSDGKVVALAVDPATGDIVAATGDGLAAAEGHSPGLIAYSPAGEKKFRVALKNPSKGLAIDPARDRLYNYVEGSAGFGAAEIEVYASAPYPEVEPPSFSAVTTNGFHVETEVEPGEKTGGGVPDESTVHFDYRLKGAESWDSTPSQEVTTAGPYGADVTGLEPNLTYEVRAVASNQDVSNLGDPVEVKTAAAPPTTETNPATDVTETGAVLYGTINPIGLPTTYHFEYGTTTSYGTRIPASIEAVAGSSHSVRSFFRTITGLTPGTTYHYRLVATNSEGTAEGPDRTFTTIAAGGIPHRAYEQVTPPDKNGATVIGSIGFQAAPDGDGFSYITKSGSQSSPLFTRWAALRGTDDWSERIDTDPPLNVGGGGFLSRATLAISDDFSHSLVVSNRALTPDAVEGGANLYRVDLVSGKYDFVGGSDAVLAFNSFTATSIPSILQGGAADFSSITFSSPPPLLPGAPKEAVYRWRETSGLEVVSVLPDGSMSGVRPGFYGSVSQSASADGTRVYFTAVGGTEVGVFFRDGSEPSKAISVSRIPGDPTTPQPAVLLGVDHDGRYAFLTSQIALTSDAPGGGEDLYRYDSSDDSLEYLGVAAFTPYRSFGVGSGGDTIYFDESQGGALGDFSVWHDGAVQKVFSAPLTVGFEHPSPNGRYFVANRDVGGVSNVIQLYDAETNELTCVSCLPDGTPVPGNLPGGGEVQISNRYPKAVDDQGTVYFNTAARLVAADVNGTQDVYTFHDGKHTLISPGNRSFDALYSDVSADGKDIFFSTAQKLVGRDDDESVDIYDARVNGGLPAQSPPPPQECLRDDCKATPNAGPELPFGGSEALSGPENVNPKRKKIACGKGKRKVKIKGKVKCVKKHKAGTDKKGGNR